MRHGMRRRSKLRLHRRWHEKRIRRLRALHAWPLRLAELLLDLLLLDALATVHRDVVLQAALVGKRLRAAWFHAHVWLLACVLPHVYLQCGRPNKSLVACGAAKWSLACVSLHVVQQVTLRDEALAAVSEVTCERSLSSVRAQVRLQVSLFGENLVAPFEFAHVWQSTVS